MTKEFGKSFTQTLPNGFSFDMVFVEGGDFLMGSADEDAYGDEQPVHGVNVPAFYLAQFPVTQALWRAVMGDTNPSLFQEDQRPVEQVSWYDAAVFCNALNEQCALASTYFSDQNGQQALGKTAQGYVLLEEDQDVDVYLHLYAPGYRLPSEAEWEYAARGGKLSQAYTYAGGNDLDKVGWHDQNSHEETKEVGLKLPNELGLYDKSGNVYEWCEDQWHENYEGAPADGSAWTDLQQGTDRVIRGGSWDYDALYCRSTYRYYYHPTIRYDNVGFRVVFFFPPGSWSAHPK